MLKNIFNYSIYYVISIIMILLPLGKFTSYLLLLTGNIKNSFDFNQVYVLWFAVPVLLLLYVLGIIFDKFELRLSDILIHLLIISGIVSTMFAKDINISIFGETTRNEGILSLLSYYFIFLNVKNLDDEKLKHKLINLFIYIGLFQVGYSMLQVYTNVVFVKRFSIPHMAMGLCANPNFLGSYMVMLSLLSITLFLYNKKAKYLVFSGLFFLGLCLSNSSAPVIGFILALIFLFIFNFKAFKKLHILIVLALLPLVFFGNDHLIKKIHFEVPATEYEENYLVSEEIANIVTNDIITNKDDNNFGNGRIRLWKNLMPYAKEYLFVGAGIDNIGVIYKDDWLNYDKAHNVYLQVLITDGIFALIFYCILCLIIFINGFKFKDTFYIALYIVFIGYSIQAFANISVIDVAPYFYLVLGLLYSKLENYKKCIDEDNL